MTVPNFEYNYKRGLQEHCHNKPPKYADVNAQFDGVIWGLILSASIAIAAITLFLIQSTDYVQRACFAEHPHVVMDPAGTQNIYRLKVLDGCYFYDRMPSYNIISFADNEDDAKKKLELYYRKRVVIK